MQTPPVPSSPAPNADAQPGSRYQRILIPLDGSGRAERAVPHALEIARSNRSAIVLLHVFRSSVREYYDQIVLADQVSQVGESIAQAKRYLAGLCSQIEAQSVEVSGNVIGGANTARLICDYAQQERIDLVVMSTRGHSGFARLVFGSIAREVMECLEIPVLLVKPDQDLA